MRIAMVIDKILVWNMLFNGRYSLRMDWNEIVCVIDYVMFDDENGIDIYMDSIDNSIDDSIDSIDSSNSSDSNGSDTNSESNRIDRIDSNDNIDSIDSNSSDNSNNSNSNDSNDSSDNSKNIDSIVRMRRRVKSGIERSNGNVKLPMIVK